VASHIPKILVIELLRFDATDIKIAHLVSCPEENMTIHTFVKEDSDNDRYRYDLYAVVCFHGETVHRGHYTTWARDWMPDANIWSPWFHYDDHKVRMKKPNETIVTKEAYILSYRAIVK